MGWEGVEVGVGGLEKDRMRWEGDGKGGAQEKNFRRDKRLEGSLISNVVIEKEKNV